MKVLPPRTILVVDDDDQVGSALSRVLGAAGYTVLTAGQDPETVIRSINEGEVYRFIRKPWDNTGLRTMVDFAFEVILLDEENRQLLAVVRRQRAELRQLRPAVDAEAEMLL